MKFKHSTDITLEIKHQLPQKRTIHYYRNQFYIQFPTTLFISVNSMELGHYFFPILFVDNSVYSLSKILPNILFSGMCLEYCRKNDDIDTLISYFWLSKFTNMVNLDPDGGWLKKIKQYSINPKWFEKIPHYDYSYPIAKIAMNRYINAYINSEGLRNEN